MIRACGVLFLWAFFMNAYAQEGLVLNVDICDLAQSPERYAGKAIRVVGQVSSGWTKRGRAIDGFSIKQPFATVRCIAELTVILPQRAKPKPDFDLRRDVSFHEFEKALRTSMTVSGAFQGRFDLQAGGGRRKRPSSNVQKIAGRLVLEQVSEVEARVLYNK